VDPPSPRFAYVLYVGTGIALVASFLGKELTGKLKRPIQKPIGQARSDNRVWDAQFDA
jgi:hypothetical protein